MVDKVVSLEKAKEKRNDAKILLQIGREIRTIDDDEIREKLMDAWQEATINFFSVPAFLR